MSLDETRMSRLEMEEGRDPKSSVRLTGILSASFKSVFNFYKKLFWLPFAVVQLSVTLSFTLVEKALEVVIGSNEYRRGKRISENQGSDRALQDTPNTSNSHSLLKPHNDSNRNDERNKPDEMKNKHSTGQIQNKDVEHTRRQSQHDSRLLTVTENSLEESLSNDHEQSSNVNQESDENVTKEKSQDDYFTPENRLQKTGNDDSQNAKKQEDSDNLGYMDKGCNDGAIETMEEEGFFNTAYVEKHCQRGNLDANEQDNMLTTNDYFEKDGNGDDLETKDPDDVHTVGGSFQKDGSESLPDTKKNEDILAVDFGLDNDGNEDYLEPKDQEDVQTVSGDFQKEGSESLPDTKKNEDILTADFGLDNDGNEDYLETKDPENVHTVGGSFQKDGRESLPVTKKHEDILTTNYGLDIDGKQGFIETKKEENQLTFIYSSQKDINEGFLKTEEKEYKFVEYGNEGSYETKKQDNVVTSGVNLDKNSDEEILEPKTQINIFTASKSLQKNREEFLNSLIQGESCDEKDGTLHTDKNKILHDNSDTNNDFSMGLDVSKNDGNVGNFQENKLTPFDDNCISSENHDEPTADDSLPRGNICKSTDETKNTNSNYSKSSENLYSEMTSNCEDEESDNFTQIALNDTVLQDVQPTELYDNREEKDTEGFCMSLVEEEDSEEFQLGSQDPPVPPTTTGPLNGAACLDPDYLNNNNVTYKIDSTLVNNVSPRGTEKQAHKRDHVFDMAMKETKISESNTRSCFVTDSTRLSTDFKPEVNDDQEPLTKHVQSGSDEKPLSSQTLGYNVNTKKSKKKKTNKLKKTK